ncbi:hypothetical protein CDD83_4632 [Cordyceps sp. RAO-2017]|nr:hypothetical protein CDD83_4632 [Cordyceps sp. RAO-2017]
MYFRDPLSPGTPQETSDHGPNKSFIHRPLHPPTAHHSLGFSSPSPGPRTKRQSRDTGMTHGRGKATGGRPAGHRHGTEQTPRLAAARRLVDPGPPRRALQQSCRCCGCRSLQA